MDELLYVHMFSLKYVSNPRLWRLFKVKLRAPFEQTYRLKSEHKTLNWTSLNCFFLCIPIFCQFRLRSIFSISTLLKLINRLLLIIILIYELWFSRAQIPSDQLLKNMKLLLLINRFYINDINGLKVLFMFPAQRFELLPSRFTSRSRPL